MGASWSQQGKRGARTALAAGRGGNKHAPWKKMKRLACQTGGRLGKLQLPTGETTMIELEVYAKGLRSSNYLMELRSQMDLLPKVRFKIDTRHDLVYFEIDDPQEVSLGQIDRLFTNIGLAPRFVGQVPNSLRPDAATTRLA
jgi:hypothetical protein